MAQQTINVGTANQGDGDPLRDAFVKVNANFDELYADDGSDVNSVNGQTGTVVLDSDDIAQGTSNLYNQTHTGEVTGNIYLTIANDVVDHNNLSNRYTASSAVTSSASITIDSSSADVFTWTAGHSATIDFTSVQIGDVVTLEVTGGGGSYTLTLQNINGSAGTFNKIAGDYDDTSSTKNFIEFKFISTSEAWYQISQIA